MFYTEDVRGCTHLASCYVSANEKPLTIFLLGPIGACSHMAACTRVLALQGITDSHLCIFRDVLSPPYLSADSDYLLCTFICWCIASTYQQRCYQNIWGWSAYVESSSQGAQRKETRKGSSCSLSVKMKGISFFFFFFLSPDTDYSATKTATVQVLQGIYRADGRCYQTTLCQSQQGQELLKQVKDSDTLQHLQHDFSKLVATKVRWLTLWTNPGEKPCAITTAATWK